MKIEYTYREPKESLPIIRAEFCSSAGSFCSIDVRESNNVSIVFKGSINDVDRLFDKSDFAAFAALINRINKQIGNE
jgi:hypothetical protein